MNQNKMLSAALEYAKAGIAVFPCRPRGKNPLTPRGYLDATTDADIIAAWWEKWPDANIGIPTGGINGFGVLDVDAKSGGLESMKNIELIRGELVTAKVQTGGGGNHYFLKYSPGMCCKVGIKPGMDFRGDSGYVIAPPSIHESGAVYEWLIPLGSVPLAESPPWLAALLTARVPKKKFAELTEGVLEGSRNDTLFRYGCTLRGQDGFDEATIYALLCVVNELHCSPPLPDGEVLQIASSAAAYSKARCVFGRSEEPLRFFEWTDAGNGEMLAASRVGVLAYCEEYKKWLEWDGKLWVQRPASFARTIAADLMRAAQEQQAGDEEASKYYRLCRNKSKLDAMVSLAEPLLSMSIKELDADKFLLNVQNGVVDLRTGELLPHDAMRKMSRIAAGEYNPGYYPDWQKIVERILPDEEMRNFAQRAAGYSATGSTGEEIFLFAKGPGGAGKGTLMETIAAALGSYSESIAPEILLQQRNGSSGSGQEASPEIAKLRGIRYLVTSETKNGASFDDAKLKRLTGGDRLTARKLHGDPFTFKPEFTLWISSNSSPNIRDHTDGIWRRLLLLPFEQKFTGNTDAGLKDRLTEQDMLGQVLSWVIDGAIDYCANGLKVPDSVKLSTLEYKDGADFFGCFISEYCDVGEECSCGAQALYNRYRVYCNENGNNALNQQNFNNVMVDRGFKKVRSKRGYFWSGIEPMPTTAFPPVGQEATPPPLVRVK